MKTRKPSIIKSILFSSLLILIPYALVPHAETPIGYFDNGAIAQACPIGTYVVDPASRTIDAGGSTSFKVTVTIAGGHNDFYGPINLSVTGLPSSGVSTNFPMDIYDDSDPDRDAVGTLSIDSTRAVTPGTYNLKITISAVYGGTRYTKYTYATLVITPPCFSVDAHEKKTIKAGGETFFTTVVKWCGGYTGDVTLSIDEESLPYGVTYKFDENPVSPTGNADSGNTQTKLRIYSTCATPPCDPKNPYTIKVIGTSGDVTASDTVELTVTEGDGGFTISGGSQTPPKINPGGSAEFTITGAFTGCFEGPVSLSVDESTLPAGVTVGSFEPGTINTDGGTSILTLKATASTSAGKYEITIVGTDATPGKRTTVVTRTTTVTLVVEKPFYLSADSQEPPKIEPGETAKFKIHAHDFIDPVYFSVDGALPPGVKDASLDPTWLPGYTDHNWVTLIVQTDSTITEGTYKITVKARCGTQTDDVVVALVVTKPQNFALSAKPTEREIKVGEKADFAVIGEFTEGFTGEVKLSLKDTPSGLSGSFVPESISPKDIDSVLTITTGADTKPGTYELTIIGTHETLGERTTVVKLTVTRPSDFSLTADPTEREIEAGNKADFKVMGAFSEGFEGEVELSAAGSPSGLSFSFSPGWISPKDIYSVLTITTGADTKPGTYEITIRGKHNTLGERTTVVKLTVTGTSDFTLSATPTSRDIEPGETATYTITVNDGGSLPNYRVNFPDPSDIDGMTATIDPSYLDPTSATNSVTLTILTDATVLEGIYSITIEAGGGGHTAGVTVELNVSEAPVPESAGLTVDKSVTPSSAKVGGMLLYTVRIENTGRGTLKDIVIRDNMPAGVGYVKGSTLINGRSASDPSGTTTLIWEIDDLKGDDTLTLKYHGVVKPNISRGRSTNTVTVIGTDPTGRTLTARASADLGVSSEDLDRKGKIKGKVFVDENGNGLKNVDEEGVAGIWILLESGERTTTDEEGMFQFDEVDSGEHLVGIDVRKLSKEYHVVGEYSKIVSLFSGGTGRTYFGLGRTGPSKEELEEMKKAEEEKKKQEEEALKEEQNKKEEEKKKEEENAPKGTIFGNVFIDANGNGIFNPGEKFLEKVTVLLDAAEKTSLTDKVGNYRFTKVKVGRHTLSVREDKEFKKTYRVIKKEKLIVNVKASTSHRLDIPVSDKRELKINIELTVR